MAGRRKSVGPINYHELPRKRLQALCKKYGFAANKTNVAMADALTALLNAPERLAMGIIDSPAISSKSSYNLSSCEVEESPMILPGVDSLPCISESRPEVFEGLRITRLPEIMEIDASPQEEVSIMKTEETKSSTYCTEEMHSSEVGDMMTENSVTAENPHLDSNVKSMEVIESNLKMNSDSSMSAKLDKEMECRENVEKIDDSSPENDGERREMDFSGITHDVVASAGLSYYDEGSKEKFSDNSPTVPDETSRSEGFGSDSEASYMECEDRVRVTLGIQHIDKLESTSNVRMDALVSVSPLLDSEELQETSDCRLLDEVTELVEARRTTSEFKTSGPISEELQDGRVRDSTTEEVQDQVQLISTGDHVAEAINCPEPSCATAANVGENTPISLSVMPHCSALDISVSNKQGVRLVVDLNDIGFPSVDLFETDGDIKISSDIVEGMKIRSGSQILLPSEETEVLKTEFMKDEVYDKQGVRLVVDLNRSFPSDADMLETYGGDTKSSSHLNDVMRMRAGSQGLSDQETEVDNKEGVKLVVDLMNNGNSPHGDIFEIEEDIKIDFQGLPCRQRMAWNQDEVYGFKCLNPAALSPKVKRSLGIDIPKLPISRLTFPKPPKSQASSGNESDVQFRFPLISPDVSPVAVAPPNVTAIEVVLDTQRNSTSETASTVQAETAYLSNVDSSEITQQLVYANEENLERSESTSPREGYVKEIVNLLEDKSGEKQSTESAREANRKDCYKSSPLVRSWRIERASKLGRTKRAAVLAGKRSLWPPTNTSGSVQEEDVDDMDIEPLQSIISSGSSIQPLQSIINSSSLTEDETADNIEPLENIIGSGSLIKPLQSNISSCSLVGDETTGSTESRRHIEQSSCGLVANVSRETPGGPQHDENAGDIQTESLDYPTQIVSGIFENSSLPIERAKENSISPLGLRDSNIEPVVFLRKSSPAGPKSHVVTSIHKMRENCASTGEENERIRRHQEIYKTPRSGKWKEKAKRATEMHASSLREKILKRRRVNEEDSSEGNSPNAQKTPLPGRIL